MDEIVMILYLRLRKRYGFEDLKSFMDHFYTIDQSTKKLVSYNGIRMNKTRKWFFITLKFLVSC